MRKYRVTKYDPSLRNEKGYYLLEEWTSFYDIGKKFYNGILTKEEYYKKEQCYVDVISMLLIDNNIQLMRVVELEKTRGKFNDLQLDSEKKLIKELKQGVILNSNDILILCKLILRDLVWAKFESLDKKIVIEFGYDYYMYILCEKISSKLKEKIYKCGLYVEMEVRERDMFRWVTLGTSDCWR